MMNNARTYPLTTIIINKLKIIKFLQNISLLITVLVLQRRWIAVNEGQDPDLHVDKILSSLYTLYQFQVRVVIYTNRNFQSLCNKLPRLNRKRTFQSNCSILLARN